MIIIFASVFWQLTSCVDSALAAVYEVPSSPGPKINIVEGGAKTPTEALIRVHVRSY